MHITIECLGASQRWCGTPQVTLTLDEPATVGTALDALARRYPDFATRRANVAVAIGEAVVDSDHPLKADDRVALIPPVSGG